MSDAPTLSLLAGAFGGPGNVDGTGTAARFNLPRGIASDGAGNLFVADSENNTIRKVEIATGAVTTLAGFPGFFGSADGIGTSARFNSPVGIAVDGASSLFVADSYNHTIRKVVIATGAVTTLAGSPGFSGSEDGIGTSARFRSPAAVAVDGAGSLFVADSENHTIRKVVIATGAVTTLAGFAGVSGGADGMGSAARFDYPEGIASDGAGNLFVADWLDDTIRQVVIATGAVSTLAGSPGLPGSADGIGAAARLDSPEGIAGDGTGNLFVADTSNSTIRRVVIATGEVSTVAGSPSLSGGTDGIGTVARFNSPSDVASDGAGNLFVADVGNNTIRKVVIATGAVSTLAGSSSPSLFGSTDGTGAVARFNSPSGIATDGAGSLFVADTENNTIRRVVIATRAVTTFAGSPADVNGGTTDGIGTAARFNHPRDVAADGAGNLFVADTQSHTIREVVVATRAVTTLAGYPGMPGSSDGTGGAARFNSPSSITVDGAGDLFIADSDNGTIRKLVIKTAAVTTLAGSAASAGSLGPADGVGPAARFYTPGAIAVDSIGHVFVTDYTTIRKVVIATGVVTTIAGSWGHEAVILGPLPAGLNSPSGLAVGPDGSLFITDASENSVLQVR